MRDKFPVMILTCIDKEGKPNKFMIADDYSADDKLEILADLGYIVKEVKYTFIWGVKWTK